MNKYVKNRLKNSVLSLIETIPLDQIKVKEIAEKAQITRKTFYRYFENKEQLYCWINQAIFEDSVRMMMGGLTLEHGLTVRLNYLKNSMDFLLASSKEISLSYAIMETIDHETQAWVKLLGANGEVEELKKATLLMMVGGWNQLILRWLMQQGDTPIKTMVHWMIETVPECLKEQVMPLHCKIAVSSCLAKVNCKYNGSNNYIKEIDILLKNKETLLICPEQLGGLPTPRPCAEIRHYRVINDCRQDVTDAYKAGAQNALKQVLEHHCTLAILQSRSPSCGRDWIYDGTFTHTLIEGNGLTVRALLEEGIIVLTEQEWLWLMHFYNE